MKAIAFLSLLAFLFAACESNTSKSNSESEAEGTAETGILEKEGLRLIPHQNPQSYPDAALSFKTPATNHIYAIDDSVEFEFNVEAYELAAPTPDEAEKHCAVSEKGQHIHLILNNGPYLARYDADFKEKLAPGHYVALAFLSRSYHESIKNGKAWAVSQFSVGEAGEAVDLSGPMLFRSRPKGSYSDEGVKRVLLDYFLVNAEDHWVRATINGKSFDLKTWQAYFMEGLPMGPNSIKLELYDASGSPVHGNFTSIEYEISLGTEG